MVNSGRDMALPVHQLKPDFNLALEKGIIRWILTAPTASGKSTQVPQIILDSPHFPEDKEVVVLQPRRLAARMLAGWVARQRECSLGSEVGYQVRFENRVGPKTRLRYVTEGILLRQLLDDPQLRSVGCVIIDEFHERHLFTDLTLARIKALQEERRSDLSLVVMSATLQTEPLERYLAGAQVFKSEGRVFPVDIDYLAPGEANRQIPLWDRIQGALRKRFQAFPSGNGLIFLPGAFEIRKTVEKLQQAPECRGFQILPLFGELSSEEQDRAVSEEEARPKIIVSTNIAETSLTIPGVAWVLDSGLARIPGYDPVRDLNTLLVQPISQFSAEQRSGRAGRTGPGYCLRLWTEREHGQRERETIPEIRRLELSETLLFLKATGFEDLSTVPWYEEPEAGNRSRALELLEDLGAVENNGELTSIGRQMARFPIHPRFSRMFLYGSEEGCFPELALSAALCQERSILLPAKRDRKLEERRDETFLTEATASSDFLYHLEAWNWAKQNRYSVEACRSLGIHAQSCRKAERIAAQFIEQGRNLGLETRGGNPDPAAIRKGLLLGFADHVGLRRDRGTRRCRLVHGRQGELRRESVVDEQGLFVAGEMEEVSAGRQVHLFLGMVTQIEISWLKAFFPERFREETVTTFDESGKRIRGEERVCYQDLILETRETETIDEDAAARLFAEGVEAGHFTIKAWDQAVERWIQRVNFLATKKPETGFNPIDEAARRTLLETLCYGSRSSREIRELDPWPVLKSWIPQGMDSWVDTVVPEFLELPTRKRPFRIRYDAEDGIPVLAATIQELYDVKPGGLTLLEGDCPLKLEILGPHRNPVQILMADRLEEFWKNSYPEIRKDLKGRYPKHEWR